MLLNDIDLLPRLLLPLASPTPDTFEEDEIEKLPIDLQVSGKKWKTYNTLSMIYKQPLISDAKT